ncbi:MAG: restriction endonuclease subunit S [Bacteroidetes bacterium]|nr:restriction endonuclease subunit S [Bacteroidota bacterium]
MNCKISEAKPNYSELGNYIREINERNRDLTITNLLGVSMEKTFIPSVANLNGVDLSIYKILRNEQLACKLMSVGRDEKLPVDLYKEHEPSIVSSAYYVFEPKNKEELLPEYLMMWLCRPENDRYIGFISGGDVRGGISWDTFCSLPIKVPSITKQREIVKEYNVIQNRIELNQKLIQKLEECAQAIYKRWFVDFEFPDENGKPYKSNGGEMVLGEFGEAPKGWSSKQLQDLCKVVDSLHTTPEYSSTGLPMVRITDINTGFLNLTNTMRVDEDTFQKFSKNHKSKKGDILVSRVGATFGEFSYAHTNEKFCLGQNTAVIIPKIFDSKLMYTALTTSNTRNQVEAKAVGSAYNTLSLQDIKGLTFVLPEKDFEKITSALTDKFDVLFSNISLYSQENSCLIKMRHLLLSKLATIEK